MADFERSILAAICEANGYAAHKLALRLKTTRPIVSRRLQALCRKGYVEHDGAWVSTMAGRAALRGEGNREAVGVQQSALSGHAGTLSLAQ